MANLHHLNLLKQHIQMWNQWRKEHPNVIPELSRADLSGANLSGADLSRVVLVQTKLPEPF
jgi:uncharacterized protein YjbI with pentapeptide repeats